MKTNSFTHKKQNRPAYLKGTSIFILLIFMMIISESALSQVAINTDGSDPNSKAILDISATDMGILVPRMTTAERTNFEATLSSNEEGMMVFDTETNSFYAELLIVHDEFDCIDCRTNGGTTTKPDFWVN
jgi:hypothetical protein